RTRSSASATTGAPRAIDSSDRPCGIDPEVQAQGSIRMADLFDLTGKVALVTGGSRGLGYQMVKAFAAHGADVIVTSRKIDNCRKVAAEVEAMGRRALAYGCNVSRWEELDGLVEAAYAAFGKVDILVNNAGSSPL